MIILVSNDDGIDSPGIKQLAKNLKKIAGARIVVVAPDREKSAASHALTLHRPLRIQKRGKDRYAVDGTPTDAVMLGVYSILKQKPALLVSGVNRGANLGEDVHYSGTVSAAVEGAIMGIPSIAVSVVGSPNKAFRYDVASHFSVQLAKLVLKNKIPLGNVLNVNVPNVPASQIKGHEITVLGKHHYGGIIDEKIDPRGKPYYWIGGDPYRFEEKKGSDADAYLNNKISITPLKVDMTDKPLIRKLKQWKIEPKY